MVSKSPSRDKVLVLENAMTVHWTFPRVTTLASESVPQHQPLTKDLDVG